MASAGWRNETGAPSTSELAAVGPLGAGQDVEQLVLALALEGDDAEDLARIQVERDVLELRPERRFRALMRGTVVVAPAAALPRRSAPRPACRLTMSPSISATIRSSEPAVTSTTPTVSPSRRTVARSQTAAISIIRCEMKMTDRSGAALAPDDLEDAFGQVGGQGRGHLVEHQDVGLDGQRAGEVDDPQRRERQSRASRGQVEVGDAQLVEPVPGTASIGVCVRRRFETMSRSGTSDGSW